MFCIFLGEYQKQRELTIFVAQETLDKNFIQTKAGISPLSTTDILGWVTIGHKGLSCIVQGWLSSLISTQQMSKRIPSVTT